MKKVLITGLAGFVGVHLCEQILKNTDWEIMGLDRFDTSGNPNRLMHMLYNTPGIDEKRVKIIFWDLKAELNEQVIKQLGGPFDYIIHLAAGSHVDRSIENPNLFFQDNCMGTVNLLNYARNGGLTFSEELPANATASPIKKITGKFLYFSTDEVFGPFPMNEEDIPKEQWLECKDKECRVEEGYSEHYHPPIGFKEWDRMNPNNPYAAAKAAAEMAVMAFANTYQIPCIITNTMNIFGERQHPEKFIPLIMNKVLKGEKLYIHANKDKTQAGKRHYLHARNLSSAVIWIIENGEVLDGSAQKGRYNIVGEVEVDNLALGKLVTKFVNEWMAEKGLKELTLDYELVDFHSSRPGHDLRYALDGTHLKEAGFSYSVAFEDSLRKMVFWTLDHKEQWL